MDFYWDIEGKTTKDKVVVVRDPKTENLIMGMCPYEILQMLGRKTVMDIVAELDGTPWKLRKWDDEV